MRKYIGHFQGITDGWFDYVNANNMKEARELLHEDYPGADLRHVMLHEDALETAKVMMHEMDKQREAYHWVRETCNEQQLVESYIMLNGGNLTRSLALAREVTTTLNDCDFGGY